MRSSVTIVALALGLSCTAVRADHDISVPYTARDLWVSVMVDGNLGEWWEDEWIYLDEVYSPTPGDIAVARYALRWSDVENLLYFAVEVEDMQQNLVPGYVSWDGQDDIEVSIDAGNHDAYFEPEMSMGQQIIFGADGAGGDWVIAAWSNPVGTDLVPEYAVTVTGDVISYEGSIVPYSYYAGWGGTGTQAVVDLALGLEIGFDVVAVTKLDDGSFGMRSNNLIGGKFQQGASQQTWTLAPPPSAAPAISTMMATSIWTTSWSLGTSSAWTPAAIATATATPTWTTS